MHYETSLWPQSGIALGGRGFVCGEKGVARGTVWERDTTGGGHRAPSAAITAKGVV